MAYTYHINKLINNNVVFSTDENGKSIILFGKAIGFAKKTNDPIDSSKIIKIFSEINESQRNYLSNLVETIDPIYIDLASQIVSMFETTLHTKVNDMMVVSLSDHISNAIRNKKEGFEIHLDILGSTKNIYPAAFGVAMQSLDLIEQTTSIRLSEDEAGFIVLHYVNSSGEQYSTDAKLRISFQNCIVETIESLLNHHLDHTSLYYTRLTTHLNFLALRIKNEKSTKDQLTTPRFYDLLLIRYPYLKPYIDQITQTIHDQFGLTIDEDEQGYLALHINNMIIQLKEKANESV